jgi:hypothetical protein
LDRAAVPTGEKKAVAEQASQAVALQLQPFLLLVERCCAGRRCRCPCCLCARRTTTYPRFWALLFCRSRTRQHDGEQSTTYKVLFFSSTWCYLLKNKKDLHRIDLAWKKYSVCCFQQNGHAPNGSFAPPD